MMGKKNKGQGQAKDKRKDKSVFKVAGSNVSKSKHKTKAVATNLKRLSHQMKSKTETADQNYDQIRDTLVTSAKQQQSKQKKTIQPATIADDNKAQVDVADTTEALKKL